ncbi:alpha/beta hydrolase [Zavarzinia compransoris]|nr:alpha/beta hydrolase [Zavarzinia compransoris]TDP48977.1 acetyl esterase [Zavarzinia compransoris]
MSGWLRLLRKIEAVVVRWLVRLPEKALVFLAGRRPIRIGGRTLDTRVQFILRLISREPAMESLPAPRARQQYNRLCAVVGGKPRPMARIDRLVIPGPARPLSARLYVPEGVGPGAPLLVFFHGGGFVVGDLDDYEVPCRLLADEARCLVLSAEYRLAPEHVFPAQSEDAEAVWRWVGENAAVLGADPARIAVGGDSAGGHIAAVISLLGERLGVPAPRHQLLIYPSVDMTRPWRSLETYGRGFLLTRPMIDHFMASVLPPGSDTSNPRITPLGADSHAGLPGATLVLAGFDPLQDQGQAYGEALAAAQVPVNVLMYESLIHGFIAFPGTVPAADRAMREMAASLRRGLAAA